MFGLAFLRVHGANPIERAIARGGPYWHSELVFSNGEWFSSRPTTGASFTRLGNPDGYDYVDVPISHEQEAAVLTWCQSKEGAGYDWRAELGGSPVEGRYFCAEICICALQQVGKLLSVDPGTTHSSDLYTSAKAEFGAKI